MHKNKLLLNLLPRQKQPPGMQVSTLKCCVKEWRLTKYVSHHSAAHITTQ